MQVQKDIASTNAIIPWVILVLMTAYVALLSYYAANRELPDPEFDFYNTTPVWVEVTVPVSGQENDVAIVLGQFNNIVEGKRQILMAQQEKKNLFRIDFQVNSPRPAVLFVNDEAVQIFLVPDSMLWVQVWLDSVNDYIDTLAFSGYTEGICGYYKERTERLDRRDIRSVLSTIAADSLQLHARLLDSFAVHELAELLIRARTFDLPLWFIEFEKNEILYQKAYLKQSNAYNREIYPGYLDAVEVDNQDAVFSYYYYLYLRALIQSQGTTSATSEEEAVKRRLEIGSGLLSGEVRDVFLTSVIFDQIRAGHTLHAKELFRQYEGSFSRKKYERFLRKQLE